MGTASTICGVTTMTNPAESTLLAAYGTKAALLESYTQEILAGWAHRRALNDMLRDMSRAPRRRVR
jgi:hypothetical protein